MKSRSLLFVTLACALSVAPLWACSRTKVDGEADAGPPMFDGDGWVRLDFPGCDFYAAPSADKMPPPLHWEPCKWVAARGWACRAVDVDEARNGWVDEHGRAWLALRRAHGDGGDREELVVAEADGAVHMAVSWPIPPRWTESTTCGLGFLGLRGHNALFFAGQYQGPLDARVTTRLAWFGGSIDVVPAPIGTEGIPVCTPGPGTYYVCGEGSSVIEPHSWADGGRLAVVRGFTWPGYDWDHTFSFVGENVFFPSIDACGNAALGCQRIGVFSPAEGSHDLIAFGNDVSVGALQFGTDGTDMVWLKGSGARKTDQDPWPTVSIMRAAFTTDPAKLQSVRLGSAPQGRYWAVLVGCGYAAVHSWELIDGEGPMLAYGKSTAYLVRLSDGRHWQFPPPDSAGSFVPLAITCDEIFLNDDADAAHAQIIRIRLDSLGPGDPPD